MNVSDFSSRTHDSMDREPEISSPVEFGINFSKARMLPNTGMTCDIYEYRYMSKRFLIKRIKESLHGKPTIIDGFRKEFEIGLNLDHRSLPTYRLFRDDYIVMDYIDGKTLSKLIREKDPWLNDPANIRQILRQLVDVIDYLHQKDVVHCDVKCDNVMITTGTRNVVLIDLGEAYTSANDCSSGDPRVYGLDLDTDLGSPDIDFHGLGMIVDRMKQAGLPCGKFDRFRKLCYKRGVTPAQLFDALKPRNYWPAAAIGLLAVALLTIIVVLYLRTEGKEEAPVPPEVEVPAVQSDTQLITDTVVTTAPAPRPEASTAPAAEHPHEAKKPAGPDDMAKTVREVLPPAIKSLTPHLDRLESLAKDESLTAAQLLEEETAFAELETETMSQAMRKLSERHPDTEYADIYQAFYGSDTYGTYIRRSNRIQESVSREFKRRLEAERQAK